MPAIEPVLLRAGDLTATYVPGAGMVCASLRAAGVEVLGQRAGLDAYLSRGSTFGVPLLHPWANRLGSFAFEVAGRQVALDASSSAVRTEEHGLPIHGLLAASRRWRVQERAEDCLTASLGFEGDELLAQFPFPHDLWMTAILDPGGLTVETTLVPRAGGPAVPVAFGYHPYLRVPDAPRAEWELELPARRALALDGRGLPTGEAADLPAQAAPLADRVMDDLFDGLGDGARFAARAGGWTVAVEFLRGYSVAQVFAPAGQDIVCFEPMTAPTDALRTGDGLYLVDQPLTATFRIAVERP